LGDVVPLPLVALFIGCAAALAAAGWYWFPAWVPRRPPGWRRPAARPGWRLRWPRVRWLRLRWPWRRRNRAADPDDQVRTRLASNDLPDLPAAAFTSLADQLAAHGRYAEAVRERQRAMVRELVDRRVVEHHPEWTVTELAAAAGRAWPSVDGPLRAAGRIFSDLWYGQRAARAEHDAQMRELATELHQVLAGPPRRARDGERP
jgi:hypothetical protein